MQLGPLLTALPFLGLLLSMALLPAAAPRFWARWMGAVAAGWSLALLPLLGFHGWWHAMSEAVLGSYVPFVSVMGGLYILSGGILLSGGPGGRPWGNVVLLGLGCLLVPVMGTAAAAMVIAQPLLRSNAHRRRRFHLVLFLIVTVANVAGVLTPIGNPPLLAGLLRGVPLLWPARHLGVVWLSSLGVLLAIFFAADTWLARHEPPPPPVTRLTVRGWSNIALVLLLGFSMMLPIPLWLVAPAASLWSLWRTPRAVRRANDFSWHPIAEVAILFFGVFVTLEPVAGLLRMGFNGPFAPLLSATSDAAGEMRPLAAFWLSGLLSAFLDNAPAYLMLFDLAGIRPEAMTTDQTAVLRAISAGAVMFGGLTYIGNAPNLLLKAVASHRGVRMPGFVGFMIWAAAVMLPVLGLVAVAFFGG